jgi:DNA-binding NarL/FixJ family response regulator
MIQILYIGRHQEIRDTVVRLLNANEEWLGMGAATDEEALHLFSIHDFALVLLGCGIEEESEQMLIESFRKLKPDIRIIQHYGGGSGLLKNEILAALQEDYI